MKTIYTLHAVFTFFLLLISLSIFSQQKGFVIDGKIIGAKDGENVYVLDLKKMTRVDSCLIKSEKFTLRGRVDEPTGARIHYRDEAAIIMLENIPIQFEALTTNWLTSTKTIGGKEQVLQNKLNAIQYPFNKAYELGVDSLDRKLYTDKQHKLDIVKRLNDMSAQNQEKYIDFGKTNPSSYVGLDILFRNRQAIGKSEMAELLKKMSPSIRSSSTGKALSLFVSFELVKEGQQFIDFTANTIDNEPFTLSNLKGQYIYLTFWEKACGACRLENQFFAKEIHRLNGKVQVVSFSLDAIKKNWIEASKYDGITWNNVSDLKGQNSPIKIKYDVQSMPHSFLINKEGKIIKIFSGFSEKQIDEILNLIN